MHLDTVFDIFCNLFVRLQDSDDEEKAAAVGEDLDLLDTFHKGILSYMAHRLRGVQQDAARGLHYASAPPGTVYLLLDYMMKWLSMTHRCASAAQPHMRSL